MSGKYQVWVTIVCLSVVLSSKNDVPQKQYLIQLATQRSTQVLFLGPAIVLSMPWKCLAPSRFITQNSKQMCAQGLRFIKSDKVTQAIVKWCSLQNILSPFFCECRHWRIKWLLRFDDPACCPEAQQFAHRCFYTFSENVNTIEKANKVIELFKK